MFGSLKQVAPPLQPDFAGERLGDNVAYARDFRIERVKRHQPRPVRLRCQKRAQVPVPVISA